MTFKWLLLAPVFFILHGCGSLIKDKDSDGSYFQNDGPPKVSPDPGTIPDVIPRSEPLSRIGNKPYEVFGIKYKPLKRISTGYIERGDASWYGRQFHGRKTSNGDIYDMFAMTAAHKTLPLPTYVRVHNLLNSKTIIVRVNDRGPFLGGRILDLSYMAALKLDMIKDGAVPIKLEVAGPPKNERSKAKKEKKSLNDLVYLQAGSFRLYQNAVSLKRKLSEAGVRPVKVVEKKLKKQKFYRVHVGPIQKSEALKDKSYIVKNIIGIMPILVKE